FFSFEEMGISPDIITMAKSLSGMGLPFAITLMKPEHDIWEPAEHNGTFRGNNHAFVTARVALEKFWKDDGFRKSVHERTHSLGGRLHQVAKRHGLSVKGRGMMKGIDATTGKQAAAICAV